MALLVSRTPDSQREPDLIHFRYTGPSLSRVRAEEDPAAGPQSAYHRLLLAGRALSRPLDADFKLLYPLQDAAFHSSARRLDLFQEDLADGLYVPASSRWFSDRTSWMERLRDAGNDTEAVQQLLDSIPGTIILPR